MHHVLKTKSSLGCLHACCNLFQPGYYHRFCQHLSAICLPRDEPTEKFNFLNISRLIFCYQVVVDKKYDNLEKREKKEDTQGEFK